MQSTMKCSRASFSPAAMAPRAVAPFKAPLQRSKQGFPGLRKPAARCNAASSVTIKFENGSPVLMLGGMSAPEPATQAEIADVAAQFDLWNNTLQTGDPQKVAALYAEDGVLLPTVSNVVRTDPAGKVDYFTNFLKLKPFGVINQSVVRFLSPNKDLAANSGVYTFRLEKDGAPVEVTARYTFVYRKENGVWKIIEHHSSAMPEPVVNPLEEVRGLFDVWNNALQTGDPEKVAALYAPDGVLLPTVSNQVRTTHEGKVDYFTNFLKLKPFGVIDESHVRFLGPTKDVAAHSGVYTFTLTKPEGEVQVQARFSFVYKKVNGEWKITEHHSSAMPEPVAAPAPVTDGVNGQVVALAA